MPELFALEGIHVRLIPMSLDQVDDLLAAAAGDRSTFDFTPVPRDREAMATYVEKAIAHRQAGEQAPFATFSVDHGRIVGATRFYDLTRWDWSTSVPGPDSVPSPGHPEVASIGYTWLAPSAQRTPVNTEAKLLMLGHAFDTWGVRRVRIQTDARNRRSWEAILRIGFSHDGVLRADMPGSDGTARDSAVFSMLADEWPALRRRLLQRLNR
jgi:RimJ/RimL family protein N-acetyltransferase